MTFDDLPLRQRKLARVRSALLDALMTRLETQTYEAVRVKDLCAAVEISEASFFNHFERKEDLLDYFIQIWSLSAGLRARQVLAERGALAAIDDLFSSTAADITPRLRVFAEVIAFQARAESVRHPRDLTLAERLLACPGLEGAESQPSLGLDGILRELLTAAKARGELPADADLEFLMLCLATIFFGTPVILRSNPGAIGSAWRAQLAQLLRSAAAVSRQPGHPPIGSKP